MWNRSEEASLSYIHDTGEGGVKGTYGRKKKGQSEGDGRKAQGKRQGETRAGWCGRKKKPRITGKFAGIPNTVGQQ